MNDANFCKPMAGVATLPYRASSATDNTLETDMDRLFDRAIVIDSLAVAHRWDEIEFGAVKESGYTGIQTSLPNWNLQVDRPGCKGGGYRPRRARDRLPDPRDPALGHTGELVRASASKLQIFL